MLTVDFVLEFLSSASRKTFHPVTGNDSPSDDGEEVPSKVCHNRLRVPETFPKLWIAHARRQLSGNGEPRVGTTSALLPASEIQRVGHERNDKGDKGCPWRTQELIGLCPGV